MSVVSSEISAKKPHSYFVVVKEKWFVFGITAGGDSCAEVLEESTDDSPGEGRIIGTQTTL